MWRHVQEEFLRYITEQAFNVAKSESKPRRTIAYKDIGRFLTNLTGNEFNPISPAAAVAKFDNLQFLSDTVPKTMTYKQYKEKKATDNATKSTTDTVNDESSVPNGDEAPNRQKSIAHMMQGQAATNGTHGSPPTPHRRNHSMAHSPIVDRTVQPEQNGHAHSEPHVEDVEMQD